ncbi:MAG: hypothetical protein H0V13_05485 [Nocardioidaceae bacterium]|nr:hypothetical protein [Nocardioidaceae bacterium]
MDETRPRRDALGDWFYAIGVAFFAYAAVVKSALPLRVWYVLAVVAFTASATREYLALKWCFPVGRPG